MFLLKGGGGWKLNLCCEMEIYKFLSKTRLKFRKNSKGAFFEVLSSILYVLIEKRDQDF